MTVAFSLPSPLTQSCRENGEQHGYGREQEREGAVWKFPALPHAHLRQQLWGGCRGECSPWQCLLAAPLAAAPLAAAPLAAAPLAAAPLPVAPLAAARPCRLRLLGCAQPSLAAVQHKGSSALQTSLEATQGFPLLDLVFSGMNMAAVPKSANGISAKAL